MNSQEQTRGFGSDNHSGVHPQILSALSKINNGHLPAYGTDCYTKEAHKIIRDIFGSSCDPYFVFNGTAANVLCLQSLIKTYEAIITASTSHAHLDECGAPEKTIGCKILLAHSNDGKISLSEIKKHLIRLGDQHYSQPKLVSITLPTEYGTCYSLQELKDIRQFTFDHNLYLHIDGARLIYAAHFLNVELIELTEKLRVDAVSFGGTKNGLLFGEIALIYNEQAKHNFKYLRKQNMQLPSKMRFLAAQFIEFLSGSTPLYKNIAESGHNLALYLRDQLHSIAEIKITQNVEANSVFVIIPRPWIKLLREDFFFYIWDEDTFEARLMISFDLKYNDIDAFINKIRKVSSHEL